MSAQTIITNPDLDRAPHSWRWAVVVGFSLLLHLLALGWAEGWTIGRTETPPPENDSTEDITVVQLRPPVLPVRPAPAATPHKRITKAQIRHASPPPELPTPALPAPDNAPTTTETDSAANLPATDPATTVTEANTQTDASADGTQPQADNDQQTEKDTVARYKVALPPPVELTYDVQKVPVEGGPIHGHGVIGWQSAGSSYQVTGEVGWLFITMLNFKSEGTLDDHGIAPVLYSEKHFHRSETDTHFNRDERSSISFSASKRSIPLQGGEQDRGSILWELSGIGRGDSEKFVQGAQIDLFVAGVRDGEVWSILVEGQEEIDIGTGKTLAWHLVRAPRIGTYDQKIDIWLAPQFEWYPVKVRYTEKNGDYLDMSMSSLRPLQIADARAQTGH